MVTVLTLTCFFSSVNFLMPQKVCVVSKSFPTLVTHIGFVTCVSPWIDRKARNLVETVIILLIPSWFLCHMSSNPMLDKMATPAEALLTFTTFIWSHPFLDSILLTLV